MLYSRLIGYIFLSQNVYVLDFVVIIIYLKERNNALDAEIGRTEVYIKALTKKHGNSQCPEIVVSSQCI